MDSCGAALADRTIQRLEQLVSDCAVALINSVARSRKVSPHHLALCVVGLCHSHGPDRRQLCDGCAYCRRRGNCFAE